MRWTLFSWLMLLTVAQSLPAAESPIGATDKGADSREAAADFSYSPNWPEPPDTSGMLLRLGFGTVATLGLCAGTLVLGRRWLQRPVASSTSRKLQIEESVVLGHRATLFLVKVGDSHLVAGTDASGLKSLIVLPAEFHDVLDQQVKATDAGSTSKTPLAVWNAEQAA